MAKRLLALTLLLFLFLILRAWWLTSSAAPSSGASSDTVDLPAVMPLPTTGLPGKTLPPETAKRLAPPKSKITRPTKPADILEICDLDKDEFIQPANLIKQALSDAMKIQPTREIHLADALATSHDDARARLDKLLAYNTLYPGNPLAVLDLIKMCAKEPTHPACDQQLIDQAVYVDGDNGALWLDIANYHAVRGNDTATEHALEKMHQSPFFNSHYFDTIEFYLDVAEHLGIKHFFNRANHAFTMAMTTMPSIGPIVTWCQEGLARATDSAHLCLNAGNFLEQHGDTAMMLMFGFAFQSMVYEAEHNPDAVAGIEEKRQSFYRQRTNAQAREHDYDMSFLLFSDEGLFRSWLENGRAHGEWAAMQLFEQEALALLDDEDFSLCP